jgi:hypothetical protein
VSPNFGMNLQRLSNGELYKKWHTAIDELALSPESRDNAKAVDRLEDEITRRIRDAGRKPERVEA